MISILRNVFRSPGAPSSSTEIEQAISEVDARIATKTAEREALSARRVDVLIDDEAAASKLRRRITDLGEEIADFEAAREQLRARLEQARTEEETAEKRQRYEAAGEKIASASGELRRRYPKLIADLRSLARAVEIARAEADAVNNDLPDGYSPLQDPEITVRGIAWRPERIVSKQIVSRWVVAGGDARFPLPRDLEKALQLQTDTRAILPLAGPYGGGTTRQLTQNVNYDLIEVVEEVFEPAVTGFVGSRLRDMSMPSLTMAEEGYTPPGYDAGTDEILRRLDRATLGTTLVPPTAAEQRQTRYRQPTLDEVAAS